jgi:hypothetical protein
MKRFLTIAALAAASLTTPALAADVGVSISVGQPGFYGRIDIGGYPQPQLIYAQPRVMYREHMRREPIYMHVPPGHAKNWPKHCRKYNACNERVYFVQDGWYNRDYVSHYQNKHGNQGNRQQGYDNQSHGNQGNGNKSNGNQGNGNQGQGRNH